MVDFAPHDHEELRVAHQHRRLGFSTDEIEHWLTAAGLKPSPAVSLPPDPAALTGADRGLTVMIWGGHRPLADRNAA